MINYVAVHKEFDENHEIVTTIASQNYGEGESYENCLAWCKEVNKKGFHYKPYLKSEIYTDAN